MRSPRALASIAFVSSLCSLLALLAPCAAHAQARTLDVETFVPSPDGDGFIGIPGTRTPGPWNWNVALWLGYSRQPLTLRRLDTGDRLDVVSDRLGGQLLLQLGIAGIVAVVLDAPVTLWQDGNASILDGGGPLARMAIRDLRLSTRVRLLGEDASIERERHEGPGIAIQGAITLPWGSEQTFNGEGAPSLEAQILGDFHILDIALGGALGWRHRFAEPQILGVPFRNQLFFAIGLQFPTVVLADLNGLAELHVATDGETPFGVEASTLVEWRVGVRYSGIRDLELTLAGGTGLTGGVGAPAGRLLFGISWAPRVHDRDRDGIHDDHDECPSLPEDMDQTTDEDGCPEPDNDGDLVPDLDDRCPNEAAEFGRDLDDDGCNDPVLDGDADGVVDAEDRCPAEAEDRDEHEDGDGCIDPDDDADEVPDARDACPAEAEDRDGRDDADGCPELDDDADGIADAADACRTEAEDVDGHDDADGCPDPDDDRDGVLDASDRCPSEAETIDGRTDDDGCPDRGGRALWRDVTDGAIEGVLRPAADGSFPVSAAGALDQLAQHVRAMWGRAVIIAHGTWPEGAEEALRTALASRGVDVSRLTFATDAALRAGRVRARALPAVVLTTAATQHLTIDAVRPMLRGLESARPETE